MPPVQSIQMAFRIVVLALLFATGVFAQEQPLPHHCAQDGDIGSMKRAVVEGVASTFVQTILNGDPGGAWDTMTVHGQQAMPRDRFVTNAMLSILPAQPRNMAVRHVFMIHVVGTPQPGARVTCGPDPSDPLQSFHMTVAPALEQAYTLITADGLTNGLVFTLWLIRQDDTWQVNSFSANMSTLAGEDATQLWKLAQEQHERGHEFNATLLYFAAAQLAQRGPDLQLGVSGEIAREQAEVVRPKEISGTPPFTFDENGRSFTVLNIGATAVEGKLFLAITHQVGPWRSDKQVEQRNRQLIAYVKKHFAPVNDVFAGMLVQASEQGTGRTYVTVDDQERRR